jgi:exodeoxyribonuclease VII small subunit
MTKDLAKNFEKKISKLTFEEALVRLEEIVETLSSQKVNLEMMIELYEEGTALREHCAKRLEEAKMKIEVISKK